VSGSYGTHCEHVYVETIGGRAVLPFVNARALPGATLACMTYGKHYHCLRCKRRILTGFKRGPTGSRVDPNALDWNPIIVN
jgi:hypothetical protein